MKISKNLKRTARAAVCVAAVTSIAVLGHIATACALGLIFFAVWWKVQNESFDEKQETMDSFYSALQRVDQAASVQSFGSGAVARWANELRKTDYKALARSVAVASRDGDAQADARLLEAYRDGVSHGAARGRA
jgi:hypothetical protein